MPFLMVFFIVTSSSSDDVSFNDKNRNVNEFDIVLMKCNMKNRLISHKCHNKEIICCRLNLSIRELLE